MSSRADWVPRNRKELYDKVVVGTVPYLNARLARFGMGDATPLGTWYATVFIPEAYEPFVASYGSWENPATRTPIIIVDMKNAEAKFIAQYRKLYRLLKANPLVTDTDLIGMGFHARPDSGRKPAPVAGETPEFSVAAIADHRLRIGYWSDNATRRGKKPKGQHGVEIRWRFADEPVNDPEELTHSIFSTTSPAILAFNGKDHGRSLYLALRWENTRGEKGPWSAARQAFVP